MDRLPASMPNTSTVPDEKGDEMPKVGAVKPLSTVTEVAGELNIRPVKLSAGSATCTSIGSV